MTAPRLRAVPLPPTEPPVMTVEEVRAAMHPGVVSREPPYVQDALAIDYTPDDDRYFDRQRSTAADLPDPDRFVPQLVQAVVEVMAGARPAPQVIRWTSPEVYAVLARRSLVATRRGLQHGRRPVVRRTRIADVADGVLEVSVVVVHPDRLRAMALRLVGVDHRWVVTDLVVG